MTSDEIISEAYDNVKEVLLKYYKMQPEPLIELLMTHSLSVADKALLCAPDYVDKLFVAEGALLHDIGIFRCDAPDIYCKGTLPYICHGVEGSAILLEEGLPRHALVCERHTGSGITVDEILRQNLPLPHRDMLPVSAEERLICYADKFFSKSKHPKKEKSLEDIRRSMLRFGPASLTRFDMLHKEFGEQKLTSGKDRT